MKLTGHDGSNDGVRAQDERHSDTAAAMIGAKMVEMAKFGIQLWKRSSNRGSSKSVSTTGSVC